MGAVGCGDGGSQDAEAKTPAGAKAAFVAFADAYASADGKRACAMFAQDVLDKVKGTNVTCEQSIARVKTILSPDDVKLFKDAAASQTPTVAGNNASLPGRGVVLVYQAGRWLVTSAGVDAHGTR